MGEAKNYTPHEIVVQVDGKRIFYPSVGIIRAIGPASPSDGSTMEGSPIRRVTEYTHLDMDEKDMPPCIIVSEIVARYMNDHHMDKERLVLFPDTNPDSAIRDEDGKYIAVKYLQHY
jgi:hypothetical protein